MFRDGPRGGSCGCLRHGRVHGMDQGNGGRRERVDGRRGVCAVWSGLVGVVVFGADASGYVVVGWAACGVERVWSWLARGSGGFWDSVFVVVGRVAIGCGGVGDLPCGVPGNFRLVLRDMGKPVEIAARVFVAGVGAWCGVGGIGVAAGMGVYRLWVEWSWSGIS